MSNLSLFQIEQEYRQLAELLIESEGEATPETETALAINREQLQVKAIAYAQVVKQLDYENGIIKAEIERLTALKKARENAVDRLKEAVRGAMELYGYEKIESPLLTVSLRKSESIEIIDAQLIPELFTNTKTTVTPDKAMIKEAIKGGNDVPGAQLVSKKSVQLK